MARALRFCLIAGMAALTILSSPAFDFHTGPAKVKKLKLYKMNSPKGADTIRYIQNLVLLGKKKGFATTSGMNSDPANFMTYGFSISKTGKAAEANFFGSSIIATYEHHTAVWLGNNADSIINPAAANRGVIFHQVDKQGKITINSVKFDKDGKMEDSSIRIFRVPSKKSFPYQIVLLNSSVGPNSIAVIVYINSQETTNWRYGKPRAFFFETDFNGKVIGKVRAVVLKKNKTNQRIGCGDPVWNGSKWLIPATVDNKSMGTSELRVFVAASNVSASPAAKNAKVTSITLISNEIWRYYSDYVIFNVSKSNASVNPGAAKKNNVNLFFTSRRSGAMSGKMATWDYVYRILTLDSSGKMIDEEVTVKIQNWKSKLKYNKNKPITGHDELISIIGSHTKGRFNFAQNRYLWRRWEKSGKTVSDYDHQINVFTINPVNGKVTVLARANPNMSGRFILPPRVALYGKTAWIINSTFDSSTFIYSNYLTRFKP